MDFSSINLQSLVFAVILGVILARMLMRIGSTRAELRHLERKVDAIAEHLGIKSNVQPRASDRVLLHLSAGKLIDAIRVYREENPGVGLAEAKAAVEEIQRKRA